MYSVNCGGWRDMFRSANWQANSFFKKKSLRFLNLDFVDAFAKKHNDRRKNCNETSSLIKQKYGGVFKLKMYHTQLLVYIHQIIRTIKCNLRKYQDRKSVV